VSSKRVLLWCACRNIEAVLNTPAVAFSTFAKVCRSSYLTLDLNMTRLPLTTQDPKQSKAAKSAAANLAAAEALELIDTKNVRAHIHTARFVLPLPSLHSTL
jgi:hypothetical protein